ncbi:MAG: acyl carrier protein [Spirochaetaceae bacterium]|nr:MAG: acyl carrier protein [Spirochaetaceae bacterium]
MEPQSTKQITSAEIRQRVKQIVSRISRIDPEEFADDIIIREELGIDSLMAMEIIATCEKHLDIEIDETAFADIETVADFLNLIEVLYRKTHG